MCAAIDETQTSNNKAQGSHDKRDFVRHVSKHGDKVDAAHTKELFGR